MAKFGLVAAALGMMMVGVVNAQASPVGQWEIETGDSRYNVTMCGDGTQLCAELIWLGKGADKPKNQVYLNTLVIDRAPMVRPNQWKGRLSLYGKTATGTITELSNDVVQLRGCYFLVLCKSYNMHRLNPQ